MRILNIYEIMALEKFLVGNNGKISFTRNIRLMQFVYRNSMMMQLYFSMSFICSYLNLKQVFNQNLFGIFKEHENTHQASPIIISLSLGHITYAKLYCDFLSNKKFVLTREEVILLLEERRPFSHNFLSQTIKKIQEFD